ncbi:MAG: leucine-rich repeat domain-containing protein [Ruminococcus sp.]|nr:leucine-rich repeat domain-containing protein [Ruminococcus sp.]
MPGKATKCNVPAAKIGDYTNTFGDTVNVTFVDNKCGENAIWELDDNGKLTISGTGAIFDFGETDRGPWKTVEEKIKTVEIQDGITKIGSDAFYYCNYITSVTIAGSVTTVAENAFNYCTSLSSVTLSEGLTTINKKAFAHCTSLTSITIPSTVTKIDTDAFLGCSQCKDVNLLVKDPAKLTWNAKAGKDFMPNKATKCHVAGDKVDDFTAKFGSTVNVTFVAAE